MISLGLLIAALSSLAAADVTDEQLAEAKTYLGQIASSLGPVEWSRRKQALDSCARAPFNPAQSPERDSGWSRALSGGRGKPAAVRRALNYSGGTTDWAANTGLVNWMRDSVTSDCRLYRAELIFLKELRRRDAEAGTGNDDLVPIQKKATFDTMELARSAVRAAFDGTRDDGYLAMKVLAVYGHDNMENKLSAGPPARCEHAILDVYRPRGTSTLYRDGAIKGLEYDPADVREGQRVAGQCGPACAGITDGFDRTRCLNLCNDQHADYQADYYHVVAANYLICYAEAEDNRGWGISGYHPGVALGRALTNAVFDNGAYTLAARRYKKARFREMYADIEKGDHSPIWARAVYEGLDALPARSDASTLCASKHLTCSAADLAAAQAILDRYAFEVGFRERQHAMGQKFAQKQCGANRANLDHPVCSR